MVKVYAKDQYRIKLQKQQQKKADEIKPHKSCLYWQRVGERIW